MFTTDDTKATNVISQRIPQRMLKPPFASLSSAKLSDRLQKKLTMLQNTAINATNADHDCNALHQS